MSVVLAMAAVAISRKFRVHDVLGGVTGFANYFLMSPGQRVFCLDRMVVTPACPSVRIVTISTFGPETTLVFVLVTFFASYGLVLIGPRPMTFLTWHRSV